MSHNSLPETDPLFDTSPEAMAARFGRRTAQLMREGRDAYVAARLAAWYAFAADPRLRGEPQTFEAAAQRLPSVVFDLGRELSAEMAERVRGRVH